MIMETSLKPGKHFRRGMPKPCLALVLSGIYGVLWAIARRFRPAGVSFTVRLIENPNPEDFPGTAFEITWG
jgi:hypothetical protein